MQLLSEKQKKMIVEINSRKLFGAAVCAFLVLGVALVFLPVLGFDFINLDDSVHIYDNPLLNRLSFKNFLSFWSAPYAELYIPVAYTVWGALSVIGFSNEAVSTTVGSGVHLRPEIFHCANLVLHLCNTVMVFYILRSLLGIFESSRKLLHPSEFLWPSFIGAALFAIHPIQIEVVSWATGLRDLLATFFVLLSLRAAIFVKDDSESNFKDFMMTNYKYLGGAVIFFLAALLSKPNAISFSLFVPLLIIAAARKVSKPNVAFCLIWLMICTLFVWLGRNVQAVDDGMPLLSRIFVMFDSFNFYISRLVIPVGSAIDYARTPSSIFLEWKTFFGVFALLAVFLLLFVFRLWRLIGISSAIFVAVLPTSGIIPFNFQMFSTVTDRYFYMAMIPFSFGLALLLTRFRLPYVRIVAVSLLVGLVVQTKYQVPHWKDSAAIGKHTLQVTPQSALAREILGIDHNNQKRYSQAYQELSMAQKLRDDIFTDRQNLEAGYAAHKMGWTVRAVSHFMEAVRIAPDCSDCHFALALALLGMNRVTQALEHLSLVNEIVPDNPAPYLKRGEAELMLGRKTEALLSFSKALDLDSELESEVKGLLQKFGIDSNAEVEHLFAPARKIKSIQSN